MLAWLEANAVLEAMRAWPWAYPLTEVAHLLGLSLLVGTAALFDLRLLGLRRELPTSLVAQCLLPLTWVGFVLAALTGGLLFLHAPRSLLSSTPFLVKLVLIGVAGINVLIFHVGTFRNVRSWDTYAPTPPAAKITASVSLVVWGSVVTLGRLIAYL